MRYQPKRSSKRWLEGAPDYVLACYDTGKQWTHDRYMILVGGIFWDETMGRNVMYVSVGESGCYSSGEIPSNCRRGRKLAWSALPPDAINAVLEWAKPNEPGHYVRTRDELKLCASEFEALMYAATVKGEYQYWP